MGWKGMGKNHVAPGASPILLFFSVSLSLSPYLPCRQLRRGAALGQVGRIVFRAAGTQPRGHRFEGIMCFIGRARGRGSGEAVQGFDDGGSERGRHFMYFFEATKKCENRVGRAHACFRFLFAANACAVEAQPVLPGAAVWHQVSERAPACATVVNARLAAAGAQP